MDSPRHDANLDPKGQHGEECRDQRGGIGLVVDPGVAQGFQIDQIGHRHHDDRGQRCLGQKVKERREQEHRQRNQYGGDDGGKRRGCNGSEVHQ